MNFSPKPNMKNIHYRQGDVLIARIGNLPAKLKKIERKNGLVILALGEATGHHHSIADEHVDLHETEAEAGVTYLEVKEAMAALTHQEHAKIDLPPGNYRVTIQREYHPTAIRRVAD